ncbi:hypothetical protein N182_18350 [Sinorhizobium sp. GL2]|nr:hypothetical protein N182_18350 [Sinorhizobium sp. GL2]
MADRQETLDRFFWKNGPCCAGCDWWRSISALVGDCTRSAPVSGAERMTMLGISHSSHRFESGHIITKREHHCGDFKDDFDWSSLSLPYRISIGAPV